MPSNPACNLLRERLILGARRQWREWRAYVIFFCFVWIPLRSAVVDYSPVPTGSMNPTILEGDVVWVNKLAYGLRVPLTTHHLAQWSHPERGDIIVVLSPEDGTRLVKRVIGIPGDIVEMRDHRLLLNGRMLEYHPAEADYASLIGTQFRGAASFAEENLLGVIHPVMGLTGLTAAAGSFPPTTVPADGYFLMGDSRDNSHDSRAYGFARRDAILGRAEGILVSLDINDTYRLRTSRFLTPLR